MSEKKEITFERLIQLEKVECLVLELANIITLKINLVPCTKEEQGDWIDIIGVELTGEWNGYKIKSDTIYNEQSLNSFQETIHILSK